MKVRQLMRLKPKTVTPDTPLERVWQIVSELKFHILPVVDENNRLKGVITAEDLLKNLVPDYRNFFSEFYPDAPTIDDIVDQIEKQIRLTARDLMNKKVYTANSDQDVFKALSKMMVYNVRILPVLNDDEKLAGFIVEKDIFKYLFQKEKHIFAKLQKLKQKKSS
ncbi:hypothetical protein A3J20_06075 [Candidatus Gottesmanbacteria bacterium RIFCSPLOWO2_02_FULL_42_29]|uniref:CBS domain-containing protein n=2 Tax=Candidatus Gottesmaniibacteriota TaxID=1752720 RepID=A0A1F6BK02_9BACT|nr:MAG: hypothetical protein UV09_C0006G0021 [Candidatus Gottesmanbacteria bacterium GW2011_GWA2_42_18]OGG09701.1 MAG: hypothetical protein A2781_00810 [Candidatus Gottesmanbacteria bacterium RIFCSPHIGHO2_01_FULL_42_27]OGG22515.1 MAG: hypothetical protein A3E72_03650 [Candidatus Gottesmanbacteria bacterium RIFCSPHIGHO2_12_FULL_43_26]OGG34885.1 MAG: hypothetical protein A3G68_04400 [Candidatus Gottesmanbacteria bacterium RIFCSPLOWO2_12_FULL_42_10]OGG36580.1 MAG: hypothetical protein A3J20_06075 